MALNMYNLIQEVEANVLPDKNFKFRIEDMGSNIWLIRISQANKKSAKVEIVIDEFEDPEDRGARGSVFRYGELSRRDVSLIMDSIMERI